MIQKDDISKRGTPVWKFISFSGWHSLRYQAVYYVLMAVPLMVFGSYVLFRILPAHLAAMMSAIVIPLATYFLADSYTTGVLGPSIYSNGISLVSRSPFRYHGRFIRFSEIKLVKIGLDDSAFDLAFLQGI